jgi:hypothetical protein
MSLNGTTYSARVTRPILCHTEEGGRTVIPAGHCLIERRSEGHADVIWGADGEHCTPVPLPLLKVAQRDGRLQLLC